MSTHPRERLRTLVVTTPAGTTSAAPQSTVWSLSRGVLGHLDIVIPDGHVGLTGIALQWGGRQIVPYEGGEWVIGNDDEITLELELYVHTSLTVVTYNTDVFPHSHRLRAYIHDLELAPSLVATGLGAAFLPEGAGFGGALEQTPLDAVWGVAEVTAEEFLADLQAILSAFLDALDARLGGAGGGGGGELPPPEGLPPTTQPVPNVIGLMVADAVAALESMGFAWTEVDQPSTANEGTVLGQAPSAGTQADPATTTVALTVAVPAPPPTPTTAKVPNVVGMRQLDAASRLRQAGFRVEVNERLNRQVPRRQVLRQSPAAGTTAATGSVVTITVASWQ